jgi:RNA polymerase sigma-70 factor (ECF subfamily)
MPGGTGQFIEIFPIYLTKSLLLAEMNIAHATEEKEWLYRLKAGDEHAFKQLYHLYSGRLYANLLKLVKKEEIAQEILQDVFLKIWLKRESIDPDRSFRSYLFRIAENMVTDFYRHAAVNRKLQDWLISRASEATFSTDHIINYKDSDSLLKQAIQKLPPQRRQIFILCKIEGKSYKEVSRELGISISTISDHIVKASHFIKRYFSLSGGVTVLIFLTLATYFS